MLMGFPRSLFAKPLLVRLPYFVLCYVTVTWQVVAAAKP